MQYSAPAYRYLRGSVGDRDVADELYQEFALRFVRGDFRKASPERGRFRDFLKTTLYHLVVDFQRSQARKLQPLPAEIEKSAATDAGENEADEQFVKQWREELLARTWIALRDYEKATTQPLFTVLRLRADHPDLSSDQLAGRLGTEWTGGNARKRLHQAREKFTDLLMGEVRQTLSENDPDLLADELRELGLLDYCRAALRKQPVRGPQVDSPYQLD